MGATNSSFIQVQPSYVMPDMIIQQSQASGAFRSLGGGKPVTRLSEGDLFVYLKRLAIRIKAAVGQAAYNMLPSVNLAASQISTPTYLVRNRVEYDHHDTAAANAWGYALPEAYRLGSRQGIFQQLRGMLLYGITPTNGEGLLNTPGATAVNLPADSNGNTTLTTYDNGQLAIFFLTQITNILTRTYQNGQKVHISILGPQRILAPMQMQNIVQLTQFQRLGAGTTTSAGLVSNVSDENGYSISWDYDDTLIAKGAGGADAVLFTMTEIETASGAPIDTNEFAKLAPNLAANTLMLNDMPAPREIPTPIAGGAIDVLYEMRSTCGWGLRPEALTILSIFP
jgi:hypothetical protein